ncbi:hypothetical protein LNV09_05220 [Paucibacter sp. B2R-40]|uniref:hypothetical protein n=1 Tax=Paucibacter sp. B2R-40 TaxID=2893554 RepID=UPI0021E4DB16|nr:hypothetical protein [Paucibacter sp. B2R-40]MCV2353559.1 hypothetical protein [Paucibacter sp. B2R-40]
MMRRFLFGLAGLIALAGCGTATDPPSMALSSKESLQMRGWVPDRLRGQISLSPVTGGQPTGSMWGSKVSNLALQESIEESLRATGMLALRPGTGNYQMEVQLIELEQPIIGLNTRVAVTLAYTVVEKRSGTVVYQRRLRSAYVAEFTSAMVDPNERLRLATEGAVRSNVNSMLRDLIALALN